MTRSNHVYFYTFIDVCFYVCLLVCLSLSLSLSPLSHLGAGDSRGPFINAPARVLKSVLRTRWASSAASALHVGGGGGYRSISDRSWHDSLAEWSKALASGASPKGRGFEPHSCHICRPARNAQGICNAAFHQLMGFLPVLMFLNSAVE